ncbi:MAG: hypothetical protein QM619_13340 [Micropruina sp.]|uniref:TA system VapC family ribonuclease toxin n=1 Tax=Micropruina sp. TaxID=2737536 RepID=UPI0039E3CD78
MSEFDLPDVNVLVALLHPQHVHHQAAQAWFAATASFATTAITEAGFLRVSLNPAVAGLPVPGSAALASLGSVRAQPRWRFLADDSSLAEAHIGLSGLVGFRQVTDLHLVNLAARHAARLITFDTKIRPVLASGDRDVVHVLS